jgi:formiminotetrahydrofolate cyclodeaminase
MSTGGGFGAKRLTTFLKALSSSDSTPGGGTAAAIVAAEGAALVAMVGRLTDGKQGYEPAWDSMRRLVGSADEARAAFLALADRDTEAFDAVMAAFKLPKESEEQKVTRSAAIQSAYLEAAEVPAEVARQAVELMRGAVEAIESGNSNAASDGAAAANLLFAATQAALANVAINAEAIRDQEVAGKLRFEAETLDARSRERLRAADDAFRRALKPV